MKNIYGIPIIENALLPQGTAFIVVQEKGVVKQMEQVYPTPIDKYSTASLIAELEKRRQACTTCKNRTSVEPDLCVNCLWRYGNKIEDNFKPAK